MNHKVSLEWRQNPALPIMLLSVKQSKKVFMPKDMLDYERYKCTPELQQCITGHEINEIWFE